MKKYLKEIIICLLQICVFYLLPNTVRTLGPMGIVFLLLLSTFVLSICIGYISNKKLKFCYPILTSILFLPTVFIYYNESAFVHSFWYLIVSCIGLLLGLILKFIFKK